MKELKNYQEVEIEIFTFDKEVILASGSGDSGLGDGGFGVDDDIF